MGKERHVSELFPFRSEYLALRDGWIHYLDQGSGHPLIFLHGNPEWAFSFRDPIKILSSTYRCIVPDHLGFGLSDKDPGSDLSPKAHARRLGSFLDALGIGACSLVMNDWGGPIGFDVAEKAPERIRALVVLNSWLWPLGASPLFRSYSRIMGGAIGKWSIRKKNLLIRWGMPLGFAHPKRFSSQIRREYERPFRTPLERKGQWIFAQHILKSGPWFRNLWEDRHKLKDKPILLLKGSKDLVFTERSLRKWRRGFPGASIRRIPDAGHFPQEEKGREVGSAIRSFLKKSSGRA